MLFSSLFRRSRASKSKAFLSKPDPQQERSLYGYSYYTYTRTPSSKTGTSEAPAKPPPPPPTPLTRLSEKRALGLVVSLARESLEAGDFPQGAILVHRPRNQLLREARNRELSGEDGDFVPDMLQHAEMALAKWAMVNLSEVEREECVVYCAGEPCPMCACAMGIAGLKRVVFAASGEQYRAWRSESEVRGGVDMYEPTVAAGEVVRDMVVRGPMEGWSGQVKALYGVFWERILGALEAGGERASFENADTRIAFRC